MSTGVQDLITFRQDLQKEFATLACNGMDIFCSDAYQTGINSGLRKSILLLDEAFAKAVAMKNEREELIDKEKDNG